MKRASKVSGSIVPGVLLALLPKCPFCVAAWLTLATGVSVSATSVTWMRGTFVVLWLATIAWFVGRRTRKAFQPV